MNLSFSKIKELGPEYDLKNIFLNVSNYDVWYEELDDQT